MVGANSRALHLAQRAESRRILRNNPGVREAENEQQRNRCLNPETRSQEQLVDTFRRAAAREDEEIREKENEQRRNRRSVPEYREREQSVNMERRAVAREALGVQENELTNRSSARAKRTYDMACAYENGKFQFGQPCGSWSILCVHGCGYIHLSSSAPGTRKKCCANGRMSINSNNFNSKLLTNLELRESP
jgi:hypothetical protein